MTLFYSINLIRIEGISRHNHDYFYEIVAGIIDNNEKPEQTAIRECFEETGCKVNKIIPVQSYFLDKKY